MKVQQIRIRNVMGLEELEFEPGKLTVVSGKNGRGKTSTLEALKAALGGGHDGTLLRNGAESGEVVLILDDGIEITKKIRAHKSDLDVRHPELGAVGRPQTWLNGIADALAFNPVAFLTAPAKKRGEWLLEAVPIDAEKVADAVAEAVGDVAGIQAAEVKGHGLEVIERVRRRIYDTRTGANGEAKKARATATQLAAGLPSEKLDAAALEAIIAEEEAVLANLRAKRAHDETEIRSEAEVAVDKMRAEYEGRLDELRRQIAALEQERSERIQATRDIATRKIAALNEPFRDASAAAEASIATARARLDEVKRAEHTRSVVEQMKQEAADAEVRSAALTAALGRLDELKADLLATLPLPEGVEVKEGEVYVKGVPFDRVNRAEQVGVAMAVAKMRAGKLGLVVMDGLECLDADTFEAFRAWAERSEGLQLVVTRVSDQPLAVEVLA